MNKGQIICGKNSTIDYDRIKQQYIEGIRKEFESKGFEILEQKICDEKTSKIHSLTSILKIKEDLYLNHIYTQHKELGKEHGWLLLANTQIASLEENRKKSETELEGMKAKVTGVLKSGWSDPVKLKGIEGIVK